jgi:hypothetical protein
LIAFCCQYILGLKKQFKLNELPAIFWHLYFGLDIKDKNVAGDTIMTGHWLRYTLTAIYRLKTLLNLLEGMGTDHDGE